ncbi:flavin-containing monooxygenase [Algiphilus aromaticivorans]|uniref:flavin-containing monooxygenase n=1 Tax=Algiphilus aromaticivorans TaxID=382454 RepID=UPI000694D605|nr:NAD(P)/FAD-dependent oxidoreductase [Algiphilus aromaticivorans]
MNARAETRVETETALLDVLIIGGGFSGLGAAIQARKQGCRRLRVLEKGPDFGGVWRENTYPGAACDVPWHLYSFSFFKKMGFSRRYPRQPEILDYIHACAQHFELYQDAEFGVEVTSAQWDDDSATWTVHAADGRSWRTRALVAGVGQLSRPGWPEIPGRDDFAGDAFHSAEWDHEIPLEGRRVGVIGTGASAIQFIPPVAEQAAHLTVFQRSPPYLLPRLDGPYGKLNRLLFRYVPGYERPFRFALWKSGEISTDAFDRGDSPTQRLYLRVSRWHLNRQVKDPELRAKLTPDYPIGCKRILFSSDYYPAMQRDNVHLETVGIDQINAKGVRTKDGVQHDLDVIIWGTGFKATEFLSPIRFTGRHGKDLHEQWSTGAEAYVGMTVPDFPNLFLMYGPNTNLGGNSIIFMIECQMRYLSDALEKLRDHRMLNVREDVYRDYNDRLQQRLSSTVWAAGCSSWYHNESGRITNNWPGRTAEYRRLTRRLDLEDYETA